MANFFEMVKNILRNHKLKILSVFVFAGIFYVIRFPFDDLGDFVSIKINELTGGQVSIQFEHLGVSLIPNPGVEMTDVFLETSQTPPLKLSTLSIAPSISGLLTFKPGVSAYATGFLGGDISVSTRGGKETEAGQLTQKISLSLDDISLSDLRKMLNLPISLNGTVELDGKADVDPSLTNQPNGEIELKADQVKIDSGAIPTVMGPLTIPDIKISKLNSLIRLIDGTLTITESEIGEENDPIHGKFKGTMDIKLQRRGPSVKPMLGTIELKLDLKVEKSFYAKNQLMFLLFNPCKIDAGKYTQLLCQMNITQMGAPPRVTALSAFK